MLPNPALRRCHEKKILNFISRLIYYETVSIQICWIFFEVNHGLIAYYLFGGNAWKRMASVRATTGNWYSFMDGANLAEEKKLRVESVADTTWKVLTFQAPKRRTSAPEEIQDISISQLLYLFSQFTAPLEIIAALVDIPRLQQNNR